MSCRRTTLARLAASLLLSAAAVGGLCAQDAEAGKGDASQPSLDLSGDHEFRFALPAGSDSWATGYDGTMKYPELVSDLGIKASQGPVSVVSSWEITNSSQGGPANLESYSLQDLESYIAWSPDDFRLGFGYQIFSWGVSDGRNPTDNINPVDYTNLEGDKVRKLPILALAASWYPSDSWSIDAVFVPHPTDSLFPLDYASAIQTGFEGQGLPIGVSTSSIADTPGNFVAGGKLNYLSAGLDLSASYLYDFDRMYTPVIGSDLGVTLERRRVQRLGADAKTTLGRFGLWAEACYTLTGNSDASDYSERLSSLDYTLGLDFSYGPGDDYYLNLQYTGTVIPGYDSSANTFSPYTQTASYLEKSMLYYLAGVEGGVTQGITWDARWTLADGAVTPTLVGSYSLPFDYDGSSVTRYGSLLLKPALDFMPIDSFHVTIGAILAYSWVKYPGQGVSLDTTDASVGVYTPQNQVFLSVSYKWNYDR